MCGDNSSVLSGYSGALVPPTVTSTTSVAASQNSSVKTNDLCSKRDSLVKDSNIYAADATQAQVQQQQQQQPTQPQKTSNDDLETSSIANKEW